MFVLVLVQAEPREGFKLECKRDGKVVRALALITVTKSERTGPRTKDAIDRVKLFLECPVACFEVMRDSGPPVLVKPVVEAAENRVVIALRTEFRSTAEIAMTKVPAPG